MTRCLRALVALLLAIVMHVPTAAADVFVSGDLARQAAVGFRLGSENNQVTVRDVVADSAAASAGLADGDRVIALNDKKYDAIHEWQYSLSKAKADRPLSVRVIRDDQVTELTFRPPARPFESLSGLDSYYGALEMPDGTVLRTIVTRPAGTDGAIPAIFFVQWVGCDTVQFYGDGPWIAAFKKLAEESGRAFIRVERSANGDSLGPGCHELEFETELAHYRYAFDELVKSEHVDASDVLVIGNSLGSFMVPFVAEGKAVRGLVTTSGGGASHFERMLNFDRKYLSHPGKDPAAIHDLLMQQVQFNVEYLIKGRHPDEIVAELPKLLEARDAILGFGGGLHYGRPYAYHQQAAQRNALRAWSVVDAPVLVVHSEYDQFESRAAADVVIEAVNHVRPGTATLVELAGLGHSFYRYGSQDDAYKRENREPAGELVAETILGWLSDVRRN